MTQAIGPDRLKIGVFNVENLGPSKVANEPELVRVLAEIICKSDYDVFSLLEVQDILLTTANVMVGVVAQTCPGDYISLLSPFLQTGNTSHYEQVMLFYRQNKLRYVGDRERKTSKIARNPWEVTFEHHNYVHEKQFDSGSCFDYLRQSQKIPFRFKLLLVHLTPKSEGLTKELIALSNMYTDIQQSSKDLSSLVVLGDFNADEGSISREQRKLVPLWNYRWFDWLIGDDVSTMASKSDKAYDRIVVHKAYTASIVPDSAKVYRYDAKKWLNKRLLADSVHKLSNHYPVDFEMYVRYVDSVAANKKLTLQYMREDIEALIDDQSLAELGLEVEKSKPVKKERVIKEPAQAEQDALNVVQPNSIPDIILTSSQNDKIKQGINQVPSIQHSSNGQIPKHVQKKRKRQSEGEQKVRSLEKTKKTKQQSRNDGRDSGYESTEDNQLTIASQRRERARVSQKVNYQEPVDEEYAEILTKAVQKKSKKSSEEDDDDMWDPNQENEEDDQEF